MVLSEVSDKNCLGNTARDFGHKRLPAPPSSTTGFMLISIFRERTATSLSFYYPSSIQRYVFVCNGASSN